MRKKLQGASLKEQIVKIILGALLFLSPTIALAQVEEIFSRVANIISLALSLIIPIAIIAVIIAGYQYITSGGNTEQMAKAKTNLTWIIIGIAVIILAKALIIFILNGLGFQTNIFGL